LTLVRLVIPFFVNRGHDVASAQLHGMSQRGGAVQASVMIDAGTCPVIAAGDADVVIGLEPVEAARSAHWVGPRTVVLANTQAVVPFVLSQRAARGEAGGDYPPVEALLQPLREITPHVVALDATALAERAGSAKALNMVMLGFLFGAGLVPAPAADFCTEVIDRAPPAIAATGRRAFDAGQAAVAAAGLLEQLACR
jgi:indolepyruvate ferredoxin oxidoreductase beta subunit